MTLREGFENWYQATHTSADLSRGPLGYTNKTTRVAWRAWQAAAAFERKASALVCENLRSREAHRCAVAIRERANDTDKTLPSSLGQQIQQAQAVVAGWSDEKRKTVQLQGGDQS